MLATPQQIILEALLIPEEIAVFCPVTVGFELLHYMHPSNENIYIYIYIYIYTYTHVSVMQMHGLPRIRPWGFSAADKPLFSE